MVVIVHFVGCAPNDLRRRSPLAAMLTGRVVDRVAAGLARPAAIPARIVSL